MRQSKRYVTIGLALTALLLCRTSAFAATDTKGHPGEADIDRAVG